MSLIGPDMALGAGLMLGTASILSVGPNNLLLMREGLRRGHASTLASIVLACDVVFLGIAYGAADAIAGVSPLVRSLLSWFGLLALAVFAIQALWSARPAGVGACGPAGPGSRSAAVRRALVVTCCNPLTYLELLIVPAAVCASFEDGPARLTFIGTVLVMSGVCAFGYAHGGRLLARLFRHRHAARAFDATAGLLMAGAALGLGLRLMAVSS